jgi:hypothetical protein
MRRLLYKFVRWILDFSKNPSKCSSEYDSNQIDPIRAEGITFNIYTATGGIIIELTEYDEKSDRYQNKLFVVQQEEFGKEIEHIVLLRLLKQ